MKAAIYCRVSTEDQEREGTSIQSQLDACKKMAKEKGYEVENEYTIREVYSGLTLDRPDLAKLRGWLDSREVDAVIIYSSDRFSRDGYDFLTLIRDCQRAKVELLCVTEPIEDGQVGELLSYVRGWASKLEAEKIKERTMRGKRERIKSGKLPTGRGVLYGYDYDKERGINVANSSLDTVRMIGIWIIEEGVFLNEVCRRLMARSIPAPKGGSRWSRGTIGRIMRNPVYVGRSYAYKTKTQGKKRIPCPQVDYIEIPNAVDRVAFTPEEWQAIQRQLDRNRELSPRNQKLDYLLTGRIFCKQCGRKFYGIPVHGKPYYRCSGRIKLLNDKRCTSKTVNAGRLDEAVWNEVDTALRNPRTILAGLEELRSEVNQEGFLDGEIGQITKRLRTLDREQERLLQWALKGFPEETIIKENEKINRERVELKQRIGELEKKLKQARDSNVDLGRLEEFCQVASQNLLEFGHTERKMALEVLKVRVRIDGTSATLEGVLPIPDEVCAMSQPS